METYFTLTTNHDFDPNLNNIISINSVSEEEEFDIQDTDYDCDPHISGNF